MEKTISIHQMMPVILEKLVTGPVLLTTTGTSMRPFFHDRKTVVTLVKPKSSLKRGDIVLYQCDNGTYALHRILRVKKEYLIICGDGLRSLEYISHHKIIAIVECFQNGDKITICSSLLYKIKYKIWLLLRPFRRYLLGIYRRL